MTIEVKNKDRIEEIRKITKKEKIRILKKEREKMMVSKRIIERIIKIPNMRTEEQEIKEIIITIIIEQIRKEKIISKDKEKMEEKGNLITQEEN